MEVIVDLYSTKNLEIKRFIDTFSGKNNALENNLTWRNVYKNPVDAANIIGVFVDNKEKYNINMWVSFDPDFFINITDYNADKIIRYLFERYPY